MEIYINNAGLVILNAYLSFFFQQCDLLDEENLLNGYKAKRAALLLQYVYQPDGLIEEENLVLNKLLCGLPLELALPTGFDANDTEKEITSQMLNAIITHWELIKNSSHEGFRESWLQREGKLTQKANSWELEVEQRSFDVLLDYVPFTISPVHFSWMKAPIKVLWR